MSEARCENCRFWRRTARDTIYPAEEQFPIFSEEVDDLCVVGECRRFPPVLDASLLAEGRAERVQQTGHNYDRPTVDGWLATKFPITLNADWCGEHQPIRAPEPKAPLDFLDSDIGILDLPFRITNCLLDDREERIISTVRQLTEERGTSLLLRRNFGAKCLREVRNKLAMHGLRLKGDPPLP